MPINMLIVDDSSSMRLVLKKTISAAGINVGNYYEAADGFEALEILRKEWLDVVLLDYNMPGMDGMELLKKMQNDEILKTIPVIVTSVEGSKERILEFLKNGASDYIKKPFTPEETRDKLYQLLEGEIDGERCAPGSNEELDF
nr:two-component system chemotaxis protein CheY [uncultured bacterium]